MERNPMQDRNPDRQMERLAGQMRDTGIAPGRDLWPGIDAAIDRERRRTVHDWRRLGAVAAALLLMLTAGWMGMTSITGRQDGAGVAWDKLNHSSSQEVIAGALDELNLALAEDPDNASLSHLVLMVEMTRGQLLRRNTDRLLTTR